jgi:hypothetical protein
VHHPGVVDEGVERPELTLRGVEEGLEGARVPDVERQADGRPAQLRGGGPGAFRVQVADRDAGAALRQQPGGGATDPGGAAGDRDDVAIDRGVAARKPGDEGGQAIEDQADCRSAK